MFFARPSSPVVVGCSNTPAMGCVRRLLRPRMPWRRRSTPSVGWVSLSAWASVRGRQNSAPATISVPAVSRAARVMAAGHGGQILVAASTAAVVDGVELEDLGEHRLRDLSGVHRIFQVRATGLSEDLSPVAHAGRSAGQLAVANDELYWPRCGNRRSGCGGAGGTPRDVDRCGWRGQDARLALQVAGEVLPEFPDGVWLVELAPVGDPGAVGDAVATALGITPQSGLSIIDSVAGGVAARRLLLVLDNCEHVLDAVAALVEAVLARSESVKIVVTSREGLRVGAEHVWLVPPLGVGPGTDSAAIALFVERARAATAGFASLNEDDATAVAEICRRLDGIALAIELAAGADGVNEPGRCARAARRPIPVAVRRPKGFGAPPDAATRRPVVLRAARRRRARRCSTDARCSLVALICVPPVASAATRMSTRPWISSTLWCASPC